jgi:hypothetical protein
MRRSGRNGFLQKYVFRVFGLYPWECALCREIKLFRLRNVHTKKTKEHHAK